MFSVIGYLYGTALHLLLNAVLWRRVNSGSMGHGSVGQMGQFLDRQVEFRGHVGIRKLEFLVFGVSCMILSLAVLTQHRLVTDGRRTHNDSIYCASTASRGKS